MNRAQYIAALVQIVVAVALFISAIVGDVRSDLTFGLIVATGVIMAIRWTVLRDAPWNDL